MLKGGRLIQPGSDTNSRACLTKQFFGGRVLTDMSSTKRISGFLVRIIHERSGGPEHEARPLKDWTADVQAQDSGRDRSQGGLWRRVGCWIGLGGS